MNLVKEFDVALPPDVRKVSDLPVRSPFSGLRPGRRMGVAQTFLDVFRKVTDLPHIGRHSRCRTSRVLAAVHVERLAKIADY